MLQLATDTSASASRAHSAGLCIAKGCWRDDRLPGCTADYANGQMMLWVRRWVMQPWGLGGKTLSFHLADEYRPADRKSMFA